MNLSRYSLDREIMDRMKKDLTTLSNTVKVFRLNPIGSKFRIILQVCAYLDKLRSQPSIVYHPFEGNVT